MHPLRASARQSTDPHPPGALDVHVHGLPKGVTPAIVTLLEPSPDENTAWNPAAKAQRPANGHDPARRHRDCLHQRVRDEFHNPQGAVRGVCRAEGEPHPPECVGRGQIVSVRLTPARSKSRRAKLRWRTLRQQTRKYDEHVCAHPNLGL